MARLLVPASAALVATLALGSGVSRGAPVRIAAPEAEGALSPAHLAPALCPAGSLPDGDACVRLPDEDDGPDVEAESNGHHDKQGHWVVYEQIPRRPERPADYDAYRYPVPCQHGCVVSGYDLDRPDDTQRRGRRLSHVGHGAVDLPQKKGTPITAVPLEHQQGDAEVAYVGPLFGTTVITRCAVREGGQVRDYLVLYGHLDAPTAGLTVGAHVAEGQRVGFVGDTGSPELVHLHLETRRVRDGVEIAKLAPGAMIANENSVVCDPRNVLQLR